jgi:hypothetical protein
MSSLKCFALLAPTALAGVALGAGACTVLGFDQLTPAVWIALGAAALLATAIGTLMLHRVVITPHLQAAETAAAAQAASAVRLESHRRLRHDIRGALSPALLTADRLLTHADPAVQRAGDIVVRAVERAAALLSDPPPPDATPPAHP